MILKSFNHDQLKKVKSNIYLFYGENEGHKDEIINKYFLDGFDGEILKYDENQTLEKKSEFFEVCLNDSLFDNKKIIIISRTTSKSYEIVEDLLKRNIQNKKIIFNSGPLEKRSKIRQVFEKDKDLICMAFYQDNNMSLYKIANDFFRKNQISISAENINLIIEKCKGDRKNLQNELNKILNFCFKKNKINREQIIKLINPYENENYFELIDSCLAKNYKIVGKIINSNIFGKEDSIILIRLFISRLKRLIELKKLHKDLGSANDAVENFRPNIFWKDKEVVRKQVEIWNFDNIYKLLIILPTIL